MRVSQESAFSKQKGAPATIDEDEEFKMAEKLAESFSLTQGSTDLDR